MSCCVCLKLSVWSNDSAVFYIFSCYDLSSCRSKQTLFYIFDWHFGVVGHTTVPFLCPWLLLSFPRVADYFIVTCLKWCHRKLSSRHFESAAFPNCTLRGSLLTRAQVLKKKLCWQILRRGFEWWNFSSLSLRYEHVGGHQAKKKWSMLNLRWPVRDLKRK